MFDTTMLYTVSPRYSPPPNPDKPTQRKPAYRGGHVCEVTVRATPKINRRRELKAINAALRAWKRKAGIVGRLDSGAFDMFKQLYIKSKEK